MGQIEIALFFGLLLLKFRNIDSVLWIMESMVLFTSMVPLVLYITILLLNGYLMAFKMFVLPVAVVFLRFIFPLFSICVLCMFSQLYSECHNMYAYCKCIVTNYENIVHEKLIHVVDVKQIYTSI